MSEANDGGGGSCTICYARGTTSPCALCGRHACPRCVAECGRCGGKICKSWHGQSEHACGGGGGAGGGQEKLFS